MNYLNVNKNICIPTHFYQNENSASILYNLLDKIRNNGKDYFFLHIGLRTAIELIARSIPYETF